MELLSARAMGSVSARLMCVARPVQPARMASLAWIMLTTMAAVAAGVMLEVPWVRAVNQRRVPAGAALTPRALPAASKSFH